MPSTKETDIQRWKEWKKDKNPQTASALVDQLLPLVKMDIYRYSNNAPYAIVEAYAKDLIIKACTNYKPDAGVALATFVKSYMRKLTQVNDMLRSPIKIPANRAYKYDTFVNTAQNLATSLDREPTVDELADELKWSKAEVGRFMKEIRKEFTDDRPFMATYNPNQSKEQEMIDFIYHDLSTTEKLIFEHTTGYGGKKVLSNPELSKRMGMNQNQLSYEKRKLVDKIDGIMLSG